MIVLWNLFFESSKESNTLENNDCFVELIF